MEQLLNKEIPKVLVQTWVSLARSSEASDEVKIRALSMLKQALGSPENIASYMKKHNIK